MNVCIQCLSACYCRLPSLVMWKGGQSRLLKCLCLLSEIGNGLCPFLNLCREMLEEMLHLRAKTPLIIFFYPSRRTGNLYARIRILKGKHILVGLEKDRDPLPVTNSGRGTSFLLQHSHDLIGDKITLCVFIYQ